MSETTESTQDESHTKVAGSIDWAFGLIALVAAAAIIYVIASTAIDMQRKDALEEKYGAKISRISETTPHTVVVGSTEMKCLVDSDDDTVLLCRPLDGDTYVEPPVVG